MSEGVSNRNRTQAPAVNRRGNMYVVAIRLSMHVAARCAHLSISIVNPANKTNSVLAHATLYVLLSLRINRFTMFRMLQSDIHYSRNIGFSHKRNWAQV